jgi:hypothetical protein
MEDTTPVAETAVLVGTDSKPLIVESKLYRLNADENFMGFLAADPATQMQVSQLLSEEHRRTDEDGDATRILINITSLNGNGAIFSIKDDVRLESTIDIDQFMNGFYANVNQGINEDITMEVIRPSIVIALNTAIMNALELTPKPPLPQVKRVSETILKAFVSVLLNDPLDAVILLQEQAAREGETETDLAVVGMWTVEHRD